MHDDDIKVRSDPEFAEKLADIVGLYLNPPDHAIVLSVDEEESDTGSGPRAARPAGQERAAAL
jgi:hypothetical protein